MSERVKMAEALFSKGYVCSQAVFAAFSEMLGLNQEQALKIGDGFGGGVARKQELCGAVSGAVMLIGLKYGKTKADNDLSHEKTYGIIDHFCSRFIERNRSIICHEILGCDLSMADQKGLFNTVCMKCVKDAAEIVEELCFYPIKQDGH